MDVFSLPSDKEIREKYEALLQNKENDKIDSKEINEIYEFLQSILAEMQKSSNGNNRTAK